MAGKVHIFNTVCLRGCSTGAYKRLNPDHGYAESAPGGNRDVGLNVSLRDHDRRIEELRDEGEA